MTGALLKTKNISKSTSIACAVLFAFGFVLINCICLSDDLVFAADYDLSITTSGAQSIDMLTGDSVTATVSSDEIEVITNCRAGYNMSLKTSVNDTNLYLDGDSSKNAAGTFFSPSNGTTVLNNAPNTWGYFYNNSIAPTTSSIFNAVPAANMTAASIKTESGVMSETDVDDVFPVYYGVATSTDIEAGTYKMVKDNEQIDGSLVYFATVSMACQPYTISYDGNESDSGIGMSIKNEQVWQNDEVSLYAPNYKRDGYGFAGWSTEQLDPDSQTFSSDLDDLVNNGLIFGPNATIVANNDVISYADASNNIKLYAVWIRSGGNMQNWTGCASMDFGEVTALTDIRDGNVYAVGRLADGNCWMMENLRLDSTVALDNSDTNNPETGYALPVSSQNWCTDISQSCYDQSWINTDNVRNFISDMSSTQDANIYSYGNYYSWRAATAGLGTYSVSAASVAGDICPAGWHLPIGKSDGDFVRLSKSLGGLDVDMDSSTDPTGEAMSLKLREYPYNHIFSGRWDGDLATNRGSNLRYWTATASSQNASYNSYISELSFLPAVSTGYYKRYGFSVRCILNVKYDIVYNGNSADSGYTMSVAHNDVSIGDEEMLYASNYRRAGYGFAGWSTEQLNPESSSFSTDLKSAAGQGLVFGPNESITVNRALAEKADANNQITLYAVWVKPSGDMQGWDDTNGCGELEVWDVIGLRDTRDNMVYAVTKYPDGNCWMIENLRLGTTGSSDETKAQGFGGNFEGLANPETDNFTNSTAANSLYDTTKISGNNNGLRFPRYNANNTASSVADMTAADQNVYEYGNYYTWAAAIADTTEHSSSNTSYETTSICPTGWRLPVGGTDANNSNNTIRFMMIGVVGYPPNDPWSDGRTRYYNVSGTEGTDASKAMRKFPGNYVYAGEYQTSNVLNRGAIGRWWSVTTNGVGSSWRLSIDYQSAYPGNNSQSRGYGLTVRCLVGREYSITYDGNNSDAGISMDMDHEGVKIGDTVTLHAANYKKAGYGFAGWSATQLDPNSNNFATELAEAVRLGTVYGPNETITVNNAMMMRANSQGEITMYAIWVKSSGNLQNWNGCGSLSSGAVVGLTDTRDNNVYAVSKLADGNCWMIENLRLSTAGSTLRAKTQGFGGAFVGLANSESEYFENSTVANSLYSTDNVTGNNQGYRIPRYNNTNTASPVAVATADSQNIYSYGNYYNWPATVANTTERNSEKWVISYSSVCPMGWFVPYGNALTAIKGGDTTGGFIYLNKALGGSNTNEETAAASNRWRKFPNNFIYSGYLSGNTMTELGETGNYFSSTVGNASQALHVGFSADGIWPGNGWTDKSYGESVRCVYGGFLYDRVESQSKGTLAENNVNLSDRITQANSGVYKYDADIYGTSSDAANTDPIYFYRGILDTNTGLGTYGSDGLADAYPNYVKTSNGQCWRIIRTTGSGGVKMIYNGKYSNGTCARSTTNAQATSITYSSTSDAVANSIVAVGYSYNATYAKTTATSAAVVSSIFGSDSNYSVNSTKSNIKKYIEGTFASTISSIGSKLEGSAGYCNDRSLYSTSYGPVSQSASIVPYDNKTGVTGYNFGPEVRVYTTNKEPTLSCPRSTVDLYTTSGSSNGNKQLTAPVALITADELVFAGHGNSAGQTAFSLKSFLNSGNDFWTMSPRWRQGQHVVTYFLDSRAGNAGGEPVTYKKGVRPVISFNAYTLVTSGSGTATDPWTVE